jgi:hypothetical protein
VAGSAAPDPAGAGAAVFGETRDAVADALKSLDDDAVAGFQAFLDHPQSVDAGPDLDVGNATLLSGPTMARL